jgi:hypothetical protein
MQTTAGLTSTKKIKEDLVADPTRGPKKGVGTGCAASNNLKENREAKPERGPEEGVGAGFTASRKSKEDQEAKPQHGRGAECDGTKKLKKDCDTKRKHARQGVERAGRLLFHYPFGNMEIDDTDLTELSNYIGAAPGQTPHASAGAPTKLLTVTQGDCDRLKAPPRKIDHYWNDTLIDLWLMW